MVTLDRQLLFSAHRLINGANVHRLKEMIFAYEQAVSLHNHHSPSHRFYQNESEKKLRGFVADELCREQR